MFRYVAMLLLVSASALAAQNDLKITGPSSVALNTPARLRLEGLPAVDMGKAMNEQLKWMDKLKILADAPAGVKESDYSLDQNLSVKVAPVQWTFNMDFQASKPGDYVLIIDWNQDECGLLHHRIVVGGGVTTDTPENPTNPVSPSKKVTRLTYVYEKDQNSIPKAVEKAISSINADSSVSVVASTFEHDSTNGNDKVPAQYKIAVEAANKAGLPCLVAQAGDVVVKVVGNPKTEAEVRDAAGVK